MFTLFFIDVHPALTDFLNHTIIGLQFFPSLVSAVSGSIKGMVLFASVVLLCLLLGRIYCSFLCPLGIFQDVMIFLSRRYGKKRITPNKNISLTSARSKKEYPFLWYSILVITALVFFAGSLILINFFDPFSIFGRFCAQLLVPFKAFIHNLLVSVTESFNLYLLSPIPLYPVLWTILLMVYAWFVMVIFMAFYHGRLYCNTLCPVGAFFSLFSRTSVCRFSIDQDKCTNCGRCSRICRAGCIDPKQGQIDGARCVACFDCMDICPEKAVHYLPEFLINPGIIHTDPSEKLKQEAGNKTSMFHGSGCEKRKFIITGLALAFGVSSTGLFLRNLITRTAVGACSSLSPVTPPGSLGLIHFSRACLSCHACVNACPEKVITPDLTAYWLLGTMQPRLDYSKSRCAYSCNACTLVCPSGAILPLSLEEKKMTRIGYVVFEKKRCLVYTQKRDCGACAEVCPTHAVHTVKEDNIYHPRLKADACIGCGACELVCPVNPKAIYVNALRLHEKAGPTFFQKEKKDESHSIMGSDEEFPF